MTGIASHPSDCAANHDPTVNGPPTILTIRLTAAVVVVDNVDPTPAENTTIVQIKVTTR